MITSLVISQVAGQDLGNDIQTIINLAATAETLATTHYYTVLTDSNVPLTPAEIESLSAFLDAELQHLEYLNAAGAETLTTDYFFPDNLYNDRQQLADITEIMETSFIAAYLASTRQFAAMGQSLLAATAAQVAAIEQEHLSIVRVIGGKRATNVAFARPLFYSIGEAVPVLQPFLEGGENYSGPISYPGPEAIRDVIRDVGVLPVPVFTDTTAFDPEQVAQASQTCMVTPAGDFRCNLREAPNLDARVADVLKQDESVSVNGQVVDNDDFPWYRLTDSNLWVRSDVVRFDGECGVLPTVTADA